MSLFSKKQKNNKQFPNVIKSLNPQNIAIELKSYDQDFNVKRIFISYLVVVAFSIALGYIAQLKLVPIIIISVIAVAFAPHIILHAVRSAYEQKRFSDVCNYTEQLLYAFRKTKKIQTSLIECSSVFPSGNLHKCIENALDYIQNTYDNEIDVEAEALQMIENEYPNLLIHSIHSFILKAERKGGETSKSIDLLLKERDVWVERILNIQKEMKRIKRNAIISILITSFICVSLSRLMPYSADLAATKPMQFVTAILILLNYFTFLHFNKKTCVNWVEYEQIIDEDKSKKDYEAFMNYNDKEEVKNSVKFAIIPILVFLIGLVKLNGVVMTLGVIFTVIMLLQHKWGYKILYKRLYREVATSFSSWLMSLSLLLQTENVQNSILISYDLAPEVLKPEIAMLINGLKETPESIDPYLNFMCELNINEITSGMRMLYSLSVGNGVNPEAQITEIINHNNKLMEKNNIIADENSLASSDFMTIALPTIYSSFYLLLSLLMTIINFTNSVN